MSAIEQPAEEAKTLLGLAEGKRLYAGLILLLLALASSLSSLLLFPQQPQTGAAWTLHLAGILLFAVAITLLFRGPTEVRPAEKLTLQVVVFGLILLALAVFMRFYRLGELPFGTWFDEADIGVRAQRILLEPTYRPAFLRGHALAYYFPALIALSFKIVGLGTLAVRTVTALFGLGSVILAFFLGREIFGNRFGLLLAFFFAVARWAITFDRLGMATSSGPFFILLILLLLFRGRRTDNVRYFAWAGLAAGLGLGFHTSLRLFPLVILAFLVYWTAGQLGQHSHRRPRRIAWAAKLALLIVGATLAAGPLIQVAVRQPDDFWNRTREVSIFEKRDEPNVVRAIASNTVKNLLMFNYLGDRNGRHNLPGEPMLDPVTGALFVLGLLLAISRFRRPAEMVFLLVFLVGLAGAILTVDFEAPQAQRAVGAMAGVFFFAALAVEAYWRVLDRSPSPFWARPLGTLLLLVGGAAIVYANTNTYFVRQANDSSVWQEHSAIETLAGNKMRELGAQDTTIYLSMFLYGHPVIDFLAPGVDARLIVGPDIVPLREPGDRPVAVLVGLPQAWIAEAVDRFYPNAQLTIAPNPDGVPMQMTVVVPPEDIRRVQGLQASYWPGANPDGEPAFGRIEQTIDTRWPAEAPLDQPFVAEWRGVLYAPEYGDYQLLLQSPGPVTLWLDGQALIESGAGGEQRLSQTLARGNHALRLQARSGAGPVQLAWIRPASAELETIPAWDLYHGPQVASRGLLGSFYEGANWQAEPALQRIDPFVDAYFHLLPLARPYGVIWSGQIQIPEEGRYAFSLEINGRAQLFIDDQLVVDAPEPTPFVEGTID
ncbi:MAG: PA14 domain-containing protein, partial [Chloroflexota bacterium]